MEGLREKKRLFILVIIISMFIGTMPSAVHGAWTQKDLGTAEFTKILIGKDGKEYYINENVKTIFYSEKGSTVKKGNGRSKVRWRYLKVTDQKEKSSKYGYCVEFGAGFANKASYQAADAQKDKAFFQKLPGGTQKIIGAILCYGRAGAKKPPVAGTNDADYYFATQVALWEAQQGLRKLVTDKNGNPSGTKLSAAHGMPASHMYKFLKGRSAEKCYKWLIKKINDHFTVPSFSSAAKNKVPIHTLKYDRQSKQWAATLVDKNKKAAGMLSSNKEISIKRSGYTYKVVSKKPLKSAVTVTNTSALSAGGSSAGKILIWNCRSQPSNQAMAVGSESQFPMYMKVRTEATSGVKIIKIDQETKKAVPLSGAVYKIKSLATGAYVKDDKQKSEFVTDSEGTVTVAGKLPAGNYQLEEVHAPQGYVLSKKPVSFAVKGDQPLITVRQEDAPQKGIISIEKTGETFDIGENKVELSQKPLEGIKFQILAAEEIAMPDGTIRAKKGEIVDTIVTDSKGNANSKELYLGSYHIVEKDTPSSYQILEEKLVELNYAGENKALTLQTAAIQNLLKKGTVEISKTDISTGRLLPDTGIEILDKDKKVLLQDRTDENGKVSFTKLPAGAYYFREFDAPQGYQLDDNPYPFEIKTNGEIVKCKMNNTPVPEAKKPELPSTPKSTPKTSKAVSSPQTGDTNQLFLWGLILLVAFLAAAGVILLQPRKKSK